MEVESLLFESVSEVESESSDDASGDRTESGFTGGFTGGFMSAGRWKNHSSSLSMFCVKALSRSVPSSLRRISALLPRATLP